MQSRPQQFPNQQNQPEIMENVQPVDGRTAQTDYPCVWQCKLIGMNCQAMQAAVSAQLGDAPYSLSLSRTSGAGRYLSLNLEVAVGSDTQRIELYHALAAYPAVRMVL